MFDLARRPRTPVLGCLVAFHDQVYGHAAAGVLVFIGNDDAR
jgi:hypothetical protein